jgi:hypothetical protein
MSQINLPIAILCDDELRLSSASAHKQFVSFADRASHSTYNFCSRAQLYC